MKIIVISDTHIPERADKLPDEFLKKSKGADLIVHAGDLADLSVLKELKRIAPVTAVWGNMDPVEVREKLKQKEIIKIDEVSIGLMHGWGNPVNLIVLLQEEFKSDKVDVIIFGHSHKPFNERIGRVLFFNPGSLSEYAFSKDLSYGVIEIENNKIRAKIEHLENKNG